MNTTHYIQEQKETYLEQLFALLRIPSVSTDPAYKEDVRAAATFVADRLRDAGADDVRLIETGGHPIVYGEKMIDPNKPTILVYGHYDVQPADPLELWTSDPFEPVIRDNKIYARGASDDKGQMFMHIAAFDAMMKTDSLPCNVKFLIEGEEESGSVHLESTIAQHKELFGADVVLISDTSIIANDIPSITVGLRGLVYLEVTVQGPNRDLHSGVYGGAVMNPANALCTMIASLKDEQGRVTIPGFYDAVIEATPEERAGLESLPFTADYYAKDLNVPQAHAEQGYTPFEGTSIRPTLDVNGMVSGYTGEGAKTVLPAVASAKFSMRLVPNQTAKEISELVIAHLKSIAPPGVTVSVHDHSGGNPSVIDMDSAAYRAASTAMETTFGKTPIAVRCGGSIPVVELFDRHLGIDSMLMGFGLDSDDIHSPNEHYGVWNFYQGIETIPYFYQAFAEEHDA
jgi:acetylornithine deacetylase/succinyl-diaminopimelate desuccinylase-like protein